VDTGIARDRAGPPLVVVVPSGTPAGALPPPAPPPFAGLPTPTRCPLPALGWQARHARPRGAAPPPEPPPAPALVLQPAALEPAYVEPEYAEPAGIAIELAPVEREPEVVEGRELVGVARSIGRGVAYAIVGAAGWLLLVTTAPRLIGWQPTVITGHSMEPSIERGDVVIVRPVPLSAYVPGVVITFDDATRPGRLVTHRVVAVRSDGALVTKGDNNRDDDPQPLDARRVRGRAVLRLPFAGRAVVWFLDRRWLPLVLTFTVLATAIRTVLRPRGASLRAS
jgi:signal peptidase I